MYADVRHIVGLSAVYQYALLIATALLRLLMRLRFFRFRLQLLDEQLERPRRVAAGEDSRAVQLIDIRRVEILTDSEFLIRPFYPLLHRTSAQ